MLHRRSGSGFRNRGLRACARKGRGTAMIRRDVTPVEARSAEIGLLLGMLHAGTQNARRELGDVLEDAIVWQPYPNGHSIGAILIHVTACEEGWLHQVAAEQEGPDDLETRMMEGS